MSKVNKKQHETIERSLDVVAPFLANRARLALEECEDHGYDVEIFESFRSGARQDWLWEQGRMREGKIITHAKAGMSAHNWGLAIDLAFYSGRKWSWEGPWDKVQAIFKRFGFEFLKFEKSHAQILGGLTVRQAQEIGTSQGMLALWGVVEKAISKR